MEYTFYYASLFFFFLIFKVLVLGSVFFNKKISAVLVYSGGVIVYAVLFILCITLAFDSTDYAVQSSNTPAHRGVLNVSSGDTSSNGQPVNGEEANEISSTVNTNDTDIKTDGDSETADFTGEEACSIAEKYYGVNSDTGYKYDTDPIIIKGEKYFSVTAYSKSMGSRGGTGSLFIVLVNEKEKVYDAYEYKNSGMLIKAQK